MISQFRVIICLSIFALFLCACSMPQNIWLDSLSTTESKQLTTDAGFTQAAFSPDGLKIAFSKKSLKYKSGSRIGIWLRKTSEMRYFLEFPNRIYCLSWHPFGRTLFFVVSKSKDGNDSGYVLYKYQLSKKTTHRILDLPAVVSRIRISPNCRYVSYTKNDQDEHRNVYILSISDTIETKVSDNTGFLGYPKSYSWSLDSRRIYWWTSLADLHVVNLKGNRLKEIDLLDLDMGIEATKVQSIIQNPIYKHELFIFCKSAESPPDKTSIVKLDLNTGKARMLAKEPRFFSAVQEVSNDGKYLLYLYPDKVPLFFRISFWLQKFYS